MMKITVVEKDAIPDGEILEALNRRKQLFWNESDELARQMFEGEITIGEWHELMKPLVKEHIVGSSAIAKGGWEEMTPRDWGRTGPLVRDQYDWLQKFAQYVEDNRLDISLKYIQNRARLYGEAGPKAGVDMQAGFELRNLLPYIPKDGSTPCLNRCHCRWELEVIRTQGGFKIVEAIWHLGEAEHCNVCVSRNGRGVLLRVPEDVDVPSVIGNF